MYVYMYELLQRGRDLVKQGNKLIKCCILNSWTQYTYFFPAYHVWGYIARRLCDFKVYFNAFVIS